MVYIVFAVSGYCGAAMRDGFAYLWFFPLAQRWDRPQFNTEKAIFQVSNFTILSAINFFYVSHDPKSTFGFDLPVPEEIRTHAMELALYVSARYLYHFLFLLPFTWLLITNSFLAFTDWVFKPRELNVDAKKEICEPLDRLEDTIFEIRHRLIRPEQETKLVMETLNQALDTMIKIEPQSKEPMIPLIISSDTKMVQQMFGIQATPFFLVAQRLWFDKHWLSHEEDTYFGSRYAGGSSEGIAIDDRLIAAINACVPRLVSNFTSLFGIAPKYARNCDNCRPRAIRVVFSDEQELIAHAKYLHAILSANIFSPKPSQSFPSDGILNIWISSHIGQRIHLKEWHTDSTDAETKSYFDLPNYDWRALIASYLVHRGIANPSNLFSSSEKFELGLPKNDFLAIGGRFFKPGYADPKSVIDEQSAWKGLLGALPIILMTLNFKYVLPFDDLVRELAQQPRDQAEELELRLHDFQLGRSKSIQTTRTTAK
jgi:hypothetical protein